MEIEASSNQMKILLVEDDDGDAMAVNRAFSKAKIANEIVRAYDGVEALEYIRGENGKEKLTLPYVLLVDVNMPRMNGIELIREIRKDAGLNKTIIFVLTTSASDQDMLAAYELNVAGYILKQKAGEDFLKIVTLIESYWRVVEMPNLEGHSI